MKIPHPLSNAWTRTSNEDLAPLAMPGNNKKFKRKSQEPKKVKTCVDDTFDVDSDATVQSDEGRSGGPAPLAHRQTVTSRDAAAGASESTSGLTEEAAGAQSSAIDMTIGIKVPHVPVSPSFSHHHHHHHHASWPQTISQPLSSKFTHSLCPTLSPTTSSSSRPSHACRTLGFSLLPSASGTSPFDPSNLEPQLHLSKVNVKNSCVRSKRIS